MKKAKEIFWGIAVLLVMGFALANMLPDALEKEQRRECLKLNRQAEESSSVFYLTPNQKEICDALSIKINAPVKGDSNE